MKMENKTLKNASIWFLFFSIVAIVVCVIFTVRGYNIVNKGEESIAIIESMTNGTTTISYELDGVNRFATINQTSDLYYIGKEITIYHYNSKIFTNYDIYIPSLIPGVLCICFMILPIIQLINVIQINNFEKNKNKYSRKIGIVTSININRHYVINNQHPYYLQCTVHYEGEKLILKSKSFWDSLTYEKGYVVDVYFKNKKKYYVDLRSYRKNDYYSEWE